ncbi:MAG TPA: peptidyl-prolyl cis-trans isomerase [Candidatus Ozemobacteraceae bacterium]|nr:peptidyl-prolyl cis-trans isomerase [Candidatus Ozemobacteraceae bacterium]
MSSHDRRFGAVVLFYVAAFGLVGVLNAAEPAPAAAPATGTQVAAAPAAGSPQDVLATIGSYTVTREEYDRELGQFITSVNPQVRAHFETKEGRQQFLKQLIEITLLEQEAMKLGIAERPALKGDVEDVSVNMLSQYYMRGLLEKIDAPAADVEKFYNEHKDQFAEPAKFHLHQITVADEAAAKKLKQEIDGGKSFAEVAKASSTDASKASGGDRGFVNLGESSPAIAQALSSSKENQVSDPVKGDDGTWMLVKYSEKQEGKIKPLADVSGQIKRELADSKRREAYEARMAEIQKEFQLTVASEGVAVLREPDIKPADLEKTICTIGTEAVKVAAIAPDLERIPPFIRPQLLEGDGLNDFVKQFCYRELVKRYVQRNRADLEKQYPEAVKNARRRVALDALLKEQVSGKVTVSDDDVKTFYEKNLAQFSTPEQSRAHHILVDAEDKAKSIIDQLGKGSKFEDIASAESKCPSGKEGGDLGFFGKGQMVPEFDEAVNKAEIGKVTGPVKTQFGWHVIRVDERRAAGSKPLDEVKEQIRSQLLPERQKAALEQYVSDLKKAHAIQEFADKL